MSNSQLFEPGTMIISKYDGYAVRRVGSPRVGSLCRVKTQTLKRIVVEVVGERRGPKGAYVIDNSVKGTGANRYINADGVLINNATPELYAALQTIDNAYLVEVAAEERRYQERVEALTAAATERMNEAVLAHRQ